MARQTDRLTRHFLTLKRRVDDLQRELSADEIPSIISQVQDAVEVTDTITFIVDRLALIDSFEDSNLDEYFGDTGSVSLVGSNPTPTEGSVAAEISGGENFIYSLKGPGGLPDLDNYPEPGDVFRFAHYFPDGAIPQFYFGASGADDHYRVELDTPADTMRLVKQEGGTDTTLDSTGMGSSFVFNEWTETEVEWRTNGRMLVEHFDAAGTSLGTLDAIDSTHTSQGVGWGEWSTFAVIDDFEDNDGLADYSIFGNGTSADTSSSALDGTSYGLEQSAASSEKSMAVSTSGLNSYPEPGDKWRVLVKKQSLVAPSAIRFATGSETEGHDSYDLRIDRDGTLRFQRRDSNVSGGSVYLDIDPIDLSAIQNTVLEVVFEWDKSDNIRITLQEFGGNTTYGSVEATDSGFSSGGVSFQSKGIEKNATESNTTYYDEVERTGSASSLSITNNTVYDFDEFYGVNTGTNTTMWSLDNDHLDINGPSWVTDGKFGTYSLDFDGTDDYISEPNNMWQTFEVPGAFMCWIKPNDTSQGAIHTNFNSTSDDLFFSLYVTDDLRIRLDQAGTGISYSGLNSGTWYHVGFQIESDAFRLYVDGSEVATNTSVSGISNIDNGNLFNLGRRPNDSLYMNAQMDNPRKYSRALTSNEWDQIYQNTK